MCNVLFSYACIPKDQTVHVHSRKQSGRVQYSNSPPGGTVFVGILLFFVALYRLFLPYHRCKTKQNRSCQLLLNVRMQYG
jgi:hypothetical protein